MLPPHLFKIFLVGKSLVRAFVIVFKVDLCRLLASLYQKGNSLFNSHEVVILTKILPFIFYQLRMLFPIPCLYFCWTFLKLFFASAYIFFKYFLFCIVAKKIITAVLQKYGIVFSFFEIFLIF
jgi:hypothetical protein